MQTHRTACANISQPTAIYCGNALGTFNLKAVCTEPRVFDVYIVALVDVLSLHSHFTPSYKMAAKFLCCLPLRLGVIVISFLEFLLCGGSAGFLWWAVWYANKNTNSDREHVSLLPVLVLKQATIQSP